MAGFKLQLPSSKCLRLTLQPQLEIRDEARFWLIEPEISKIYINE